MVRLRLTKNFPIMMSLTTEEGLDRMCNTMRQFFPRGKIPVVCPKCSTKNDIDVEDLIKHMKEHSKDDKPHEFDDCKKCGLSLVFEQPMGPKREPDVHGPKTTEVFARKAEADALRMAEAQRKAQAQAAAAKKEMEQVPKRWDAKTGKWVETAK